MGDRNFQSDNASGAAPEIVAALAEARTGFAAPYGEDPWTRRVEAKFSEIFERPVTSFPVATGTSANALALSCLAPAYGAVYCHPDAHINTDECGAPEFFTGGAKLVLVPGPHGKIPAEALSALAPGRHRGRQHSVQPAALSLTQATEAGTVYRLDEIRALSEVARAHGLKVHMDGARFANALQSLGASPAEATWRAGVDVLSFGATKNGALAAEAVIFFDDALAAEFLFRRKRAGHLFSKMRFLSAQLEAYLEGDLWLRNAERANRLARELGEGLRAVPGVALESPVEANEVFAYLPEAVTRALLDQGFVFYVRGTDGVRDRVRLLCAFDTDEADIDALLASAGEAAAGTNTAAAKAAG